MNDITPKEASEILSHYTNLGYGIIIEGDDISKIMQALSLASKTMASGGDLISREALKEAFHKDIMGGLNWKSIIDNASTIPLPILNEQISWEQGFEAGLAQGKHDRPQGEWIAIEPYTHKTFCPFCKEDTRFEVGKYDNFCPNCGADLRGGDNE